MSTERSDSWFSLRELQPAKPQRNQRGNQRAKSRRSTPDWEFGAEAKADQRADLPPLPQGPTTRPTLPRPTVELLGAKHAATARSPSVSPTVSTTRSLVDHLQNDGGARRAMATRLAIDDALDQWWTDGTLPPLTLLRDGLLLVEAGYTLDETQRSFLLRVALRRQRGMITALRYQGDPDRTAFLIKDALLDSKHPLPPHFLAELQQEDEQSSVWMDYLLHDLAYEVGVAQGKRRQLAANVLAQIGRESTRVTAFTNSDNTPDSTTDRRFSVPPLSHRWTVRWLLWALCILLLAVGYAAFHRTVYAQTVRIPAGSYTISDPLSEGRTRTVVLNAFRIDLTEVTNNAYQRCHAGGGCRLPSSEASATRADYFTNPSYARFPVVNVDWDSANAYCEWLGKRLPTVEEWEVATSIAPLTQRYFRYPWGNRFDPQLANGGSAASVDTRAVGDFHPVGDSSFGLRDAVGNVAEWTASPSSQPFNGFVVKGGSYRDTVDLLRLDAQQNWVRTTQADWLGFRCASD